MIETFIGSFLKSEENSELMDTANAGVWTNTISQIFIVICYLTLYTLALQYAEQLEAFRIKPYIYKFYSKYPNFFTLICAASLIIFFNTNTVYAHGGENISNVSKDPVRDFINSLDRDEFEIFHNAFVNGLNVNVQLVQEDLEDNELIPQSDTGHSIKWQSILIFASGTLLMILLANWDLAIQLMKLFMKSVWDLGTEVIFKIAKEILIYKASRAVEDPFTANAFELGLRAVQTYRAQR